MRVLVTREELAARVESLGHDAVFCELIRVEPLGDEPVDARAYDWLVVTSRNGAHELGRRGVTANRIAAIGPATAEALRSHGLPVDYYATYQQRVESVTKDDVARAARERLHPDDMAIVVVGPSQQIAPRLEALNLGHIELRDAEGEARKAVSAAAGR